MFVWFCVMWIGDKTNKDKDTNTSSDCSNNKNKVKKRGFVRTLLFLQPGTTFVHSFNFNNNDKGEGGQQHKRRCNPFSLSRPNSTIPFRNNLSLNHPFCVIQQPICMLGRLLSKQSCSPFILFLPHCFRSVCSNSFTKYINPFRLDPSPRSISTFLPSTHRIPPALALSPHLPFSPLVSAHSPSPSSIHISPDYPFLENHTYPFFLFLPQSMTVTTT